MRHKLRPFSLAALLVLVMVRAASAAISFIPAQPNVDQTVSFTLSPNLPVIVLSVRWDFGDGTTAAGQMTVHKSYHASGTFPVRVTYNVIGIPTLYTETTSITVVERRSISYTPPAPQINQNIIFQAQNFLSSNIRWDFGDGQSLVGGPAAVHTYLVAGTYLIQAWDWGGAYGSPTSLSLRVREAIGPRAAFQIFFLQLRFGDGKSYKVVPRDFQGLTVYADIKYEGTGLFRARWLVDGAPFRITTRAMPFAEDMTLDSSGAVPGQAPILPGLPANLPGTHEVSLEILEPAADFVIPVIRYFVSADTAEAAQDLAGVRLDIESVRGAPGVDCRLGAGVLEAPAGRYIILNGLMTYGLQRPPVKLALLRIHLESKLIDQQFLKNLGPGEDRAFGTSILSASAENKWIYLTVYSLDQDKAELLFFQKMKLYAP